MISGHATKKGTLRFADRFPAARDAGFYRDVESLAVSNIGIGTYLGEADDATDEAYSAAVRAAIWKGVNFLDTSLNYRGQRSEKAIGKSLAAMFAAGEIKRDEVVVCTKAGYLTPGA